MQLKNCGIKRFERQMQNKNIICFGAGKYLREFCNHCNIENQIAFIIDNNEKLWNTFINIKGQNIKIVSFDTALNQILPEDILLITAGMQLGYEIYEIIEKNYYFNNLTTYWAFLIMNSNETKTERRSKMNLKIKLTNEIIIPKIIHYCWFGKNPIPEEFQKYIAGWKEKCPDFEIVKWDESNYDVSKNLYMKQAYEAKKWGFVPDYARKDIIYNYGGIYLDTDVEVIKNLEDLLYQDGFCGFEDSSKVAFGLGFGAKKGLNIIKILRDMYDNLEFEYDEDKIITGPDYETMTLCQNGLKNDGSHQIIKGLTVYTTDVLSGTNTCDNKPFITENTFTVHHYAATWTSNKFKTLKKRINDIQKSYIL